MLDGSMAEYCLVPAVNSSACRSGMIHMALTLLMVCVKTVPLEMGQPGTASRELKHDLDSTIYLIK